MNGRLRAPVAHPDNMNPPQQPLESPYKGKSGLARLIKALGYSLSGLDAAYRNEHAFRLEVACGAVMIPLALFLPASGIGKALMIASVLLVLIIELVNSAIEAIVDRVSLERHPLAGRAKDIGSAAVLLAVINAAVVWGFVLFG